MAEKPKPRRSKRVNGDGTVYRRGSAWEAAITVDGRRRTARAATKADAEAALRRLRAQRDTGQLPRQGDTTVEQYLLHWLGTRKPDLAYTTHRRYSEIVRLHIVPVVGRVPLVKLTPVHVRSVFTAASEKGLSKQTVLHVSRVLHNACEVAVAEDRLDRNPVARVKRKPLPLIPPDVFTPAQVVVLLKAARSHEFGALFALAVTGGARQGELLGLRWSDIDLKTEKTVNIRGAMRKVEQGRSLGDTKTAESNRQIELSTSALTLLAEYRRNQMKLRLAAGDQWAAGDLVFTDEVGRGLNPDRVRRRWRTFSANAGLPVIQFRNLRHTYATVHLDSGTPDVVVTKSMGHTRTSTTDTYYKRVARRHLQDAAKRFDAVLEAATEADVAGGVAGGEAPDTAVGDAQ